MQKGKVIFEDTFTDDSGGWDSDPDASFGKPALTLKLHEPTANWIYTNNTFNATDGDYCVEAVLPNGPAPDNLAYIGLGVLYTDANNFLLLQLDSNDNITMWRKASGKWTKIGDLTDATIKPKPGSVVTLRMVVHGTLVAPSVNGTDLKKVRVQIPDGALNFGVYAQLDKSVPNPGVEFQFNRFRVTAGQ